LIQHTTTMQQKDASVAEKAEAGLALAESLGDAWVAYHVKLNGYTQKTSGGGAILNQYISHAIDATLKSGMHKGDPYTTPVKKVVKEGEEEERVTLIKFAQTPSPVKKVSVYLGSFVSFVKKSVKTYNTLETEINRLFPLDPLDSIFDDDSKKTKKKKPSDDPNYKRDVEKLFNQLGVLLYNTLAWFIKLTTSTLHIKLVRSLGDRKLNKSGVTVDSLRNLVESIYLKINRNAVRSFAAVGRGNVRHNMNMFENIVVDDNLLVIYNALLVRFRYIRLTHGTPMEWHEITDGEYKYFKFHMHILYLIDKKRTTSPLNQRILREMGAIAKRMRQIAAQAAERERIIEAKRAAERERIIEAKRAAERKREAKRKREAEKTKKPKRKPRRSTRRKGN